jgi:O-antigen/teichoic acid export membrane protein
MRALFPIVANQLATLLVGVVALKLVSKFIPPSLNGAYTIFLTLTQFGALLTHSGVINHGMRYWQRERDHAGAYARFLWRASWRKLAYLIPLLVVVSVLIALYEEDPIWILILPMLIVGNVTMALQGTATGVLNAELRLWKVFAVTFIANASRTLFPVGLALLAGMTLFVLSAGYALHAVVLIACLAGLFFWVRKTPPGSPEITAKWTQEFRDYGRPFIWMGIGAWLLQFVDRWVVKYFFDDTQAGLFAYAVNMGAIVPTLVTGGVMQLVFPAIFREADSAKTKLDWERIARSCDRATLVFVGLTLTGVYLLKVIAPYLQGWLISEAYGQSIGMILPAGLAMALVQVNQFYFLLLQGQHNSAGMIRIMMVMAGLKTLGSIVAASISWSALMNWLITSVILAGLLGRIMIRRMALSDRPDTTRSNEL